MSFFDPNRKMTSHPALGRLYYFSEKPNHIQHYFQEYEPGKISEGIYEEIYKGLIDMRLTSIHGTGKANKSDLAFIEILEKYVAGKAKEAGHPVHQWERDAFDRLKALKIKATDLQKRTQTKTA